MQCPRCQHENPPKATFCDECGSRLEVVCGARPCPLTKAGQPDRLQEKTRLSHVTFWPTFSRCSTPAVLEQAVATTARGLQSLVQIEGRI